MNRRIFLGAAAALAALPTTKNEALDDSRGNVREGSLGTRRLRFDDHTELFGGVSTPQPESDSSEVRVSGYYHDDEPGTVMFQIQVENARAYLGLTPDEARGLARDLIDAADHADTG